MLEEQTNNRVTEVAEIQNELARVLASQTFRRANRMRELLGYVVKGSLDGVALTEAKAAHEVFGKGQDFDSSIDPEVRIQYGRLRRKLAEYYASEGKQAPVMIDLPPRKYGPVFVAHKQETEPDPLPGESLPEPSARSIAVLPLANLTNDPSHDTFCYGLTEELITNLALNAFVDVVAGTSAFQFKNRPVDVREAGEQLGVRMILEGSVRMEDDHTRVMIRLARVNDGIAIWSDSFDAKLDGALNTQQGVAHKILESLHHELARNDA